MAASSAGDVDAVMADYSDTALVISPNGKTHGKEAIRKVFQDLLAGGKHISPVLKQQYYTPKVAYITWVLGEGSARN